jgi:Uri superfamily endonuclease
LILHARSPAKINVGRWGTLDVTPGYYIYIGSAFGPGGVSARIARHCRGVKTLRWHIDYLREVTTPVQAWCGYAGRDLEHGWARIFSGLGGVSSVPGFGCSDCQCQSHLFVPPGRPDPGQFSVAAGMRPQVRALQTVCEPANQPATITGNPQ